MVKQQKTSQKEFSNRSLYFLLAAATLAVLIFGSRYLKASQKNKMEKRILPAIMKKAINNNQAKITISNLKEVAGVYQFDLDINGQKYVSYVTKDGKLLFPSAIKTEPDAKTSASTDTPEPKKLTCSDIGKSTNSKLTAFVVSDCPFGLQMQRVFKTAIKEIPDLKNYLTVKYIGAIQNGKITSMHGDKEAQENLRQICIREEQQDLYWPYVSCYMQEGKSTECLADAGIDQTKLESCATDKNRGLKYAQADFNSANKLKIGGSPTLLMNNKQIVSEFDFGGRVANSVKQILCCGSQTKPEFCRNNISTQELASSFSLTDEATTGTTTNQNAGCGN